MDCPVDCDGFDAGCDLAMAFSRGILVEKNVPLGLFRDFSYEKNLCF